MDIRISIGTSLHPQDKVVAKTGTVREKLTELNIPFTDGQVTLNGRVLGTAEMNKTFEELDVKDGDYILATNKHGSGANPL